MSVVVLTELRMPGSADAWAALGFSLEGETFVCGLVRCVVNSEPAWSFDELRSDPSTLGVPTAVADSPQATVSHRCLIDRIDHVVYTVPSLDEAVDTLTSVLGAPPRRRFHPRGPDGPEMAFFRVGEAFIEVVSSGRPPSIMGVAFNSPDLDATVAAVRERGGPIGDPKPAVQGGRIASVWREHVAFPVAVMEPR